LRISADRFSGALFHSRVNNYLMRLRFRKMSDAKNGPSKL